MISVRDKESRVGDQRCWSILPFPWYQAFFCCFLYGCIYCIDTWYLFHHLIWHTIYTWLFIISSFLVPIEATYEYGIDTHFVGYCIPRDRTVPGILRDAPNVFAGWMNWSPWYGVVRASLSEIWVERWQEREYVTGGLEDHCSRQKGQLWLEQSDQRRIQSKAREGIRDQIMESFKGHCKTQTKGLRRLNCCWVYIGVTAPWLLCWKQTKGVQR